MKIILSTVQSPLWALLLAADEAQRVRALDFAERRARLHRNLHAQYGEHALIAGQAPAAVANALARYFAGELGALDGVAISTAGTTHQETIWAALRRIHAEKTTTYGLLARSIGNDDWRAAVEVGVAVGSNPIAIVVPCHRVLGANGDLKGYAWGLHRKRWLLQHEGAMHAAAPQAELLFERSSNGSGPKQDQFV